MLLLKVTILLCIAALLHHKLLIALSKQALVNNGVNSFSLDYKKFFTPLFDVAAMANQELPEELKSLKGTDMRLHFLMDYTDNGIEFVSTVDSKVN